MNTQKNGLYKKRRFWLWWGVVCGIVLLPFVLIIVFSAYAIPLHDLTMEHLERDFADIKHPDGAILLEHHTHFGDGPYRAGSGNDACHYYVAEIRLLTTSLEDVMRHYDTHTQYFSREFSDIEVNILAATEDIRGFHVDHPLVGWIQSYMSVGGQEAYLVYVKKVDENVSGDFRCWLI